MKLTLYQKQQKALKEKIARREYESNKQLIESLKTISISTGILKLKLLDTIKNIDNYDFKEKSDEYYGELIKEFQGKESKYIETKLKELNLM